jgi:signal transduction histidine kinase
MLVNPALSQLTETLIKDLTGMALNEFVQTRELSPAGRGMIMELVEHPDKIETGIRVEWGKKTLSVSIARVQDTTTNEKIGTVAVFRDVTREAELEKMKETFVAIVSHELRTPLNAIIGHVEMLQESIFGPINEQQSAVMDRVMVNTRRLLAMVGELLDEAQMKAGKLSILKQAFKASSLLENLHNTMDKIATDKGLYLTDEFDPNMPEIIASDPQRLQQILVNLVNNSVKFTEKGGIHVRILHVDENRWKIEVIDTGSGIPEQEIPHIFETFQQVEGSTTRQHGGFGLGLAIVKQLVELMKGEITVKSELDKGSTFTVTLPL